jgi:hypothetical protein
MMLAWLQNNLGTLAVSGVLLALLAVIARHVIKEKKRGGGCGCGCSSCAMRDRCHQTTEKES